MSGDVFDPAADGWTDIGCGVWIMTFTEGNSQTPGGLIEAHRNAAGEWCQGAIHFSGRGHSTPPLWDVVNATPLTLSPSLLCRTCGHHGFIRDGKWVPA